MIRRRDMLVITWNFPPRSGGIENLVAQLCTQVRTKRIVKVITSHIPYRQLEEDWIYRSRLPGLVPFLFYALSEGSRILKNDPRMKLVLAGSALTAPIVVLLARIYRRKAIGNVHGLDLLYANRFYQALCVRWVGRCDRVIANSRYTASLAVNKGVRSDAVVVIPPGVDSRSFERGGTHDAKQELGIEGKKIVLFVGRLARRKGVKEFLQWSFPQVRAEVPEACFVIVGANPVESLVHDGDVLGEIRRVVKEMSLEGHVRALGRLDDRDLARWYQAADLLVLPALATTTDVEGFGIVILEAAAAGKPCVATRVGGIPDAVEDGKTGILVEPGDYPMMSRAVVTLLRDNDLRQTMGAYGRQRVTEKFDWSKIVGRYEELFSSLGE